MNRILTTLILLLFTFQCRIFKPSSLDPGEDLGSLQSLLRLLSLADAFNTYSQTVVFMKFTDSNGTPYSTGTVEYSIFNEADENGIPVSPYGANIQPLTVTLDANGRGFLFFNERGIANLTVKSSGNNVGTVNFRIYNGITKQSFSILSQTGATQFILEDLANYRNGMGSSSTFTPLGSANGRQFIYVEVPTIITGTNQYTSTGYIASSADGENYDQVTKIDGVILERNVTYETTLEISTPMFNGFEYVFFLSEEKRDFPTITNFQSNRNLFVQIPSVFPPTSVTAQPKVLPANYRLFSYDNRPWFYPALYLGSGSYMITPMVSTIPHPLLVRLDSDITSDLANDYGCVVSSVDQHLVAYQVITHSGINYLQCPTNLLGGTTFTSKSIRIPDLAINQVTFDGNAIAFDSPIFQIQNQLIAFLGSSPYNGYAFPNGSYGFSNPTITRNTSPIPGLNSSILGPSSHLRTVKSSNSKIYFLLSNVPDFSVAPTLEIYRSTENLASASILPTIPVLYNSPPTFNPEQLQSANGKLNYSYTIGAGTGIDSRPVNLTYFTQNDGTWEVLPRLIKIR